MELSVTQLKARCSAVIEQVQKQGMRVMITRHGRPVAELVPVRANSPNALFGRARNTTVIHSDLLSSGEF